MVTLTLLGAIHFFRKAISLLLHLVLNKPTSFGVTTAMCRDVTKLRPWMAKQKGQVVQEMIILILREESAEQN